MCRLLAQSLEDLIATGAEAKAIGDYALLRARVIRQSFGLIVNSLTCRSPMVRVGQSSYVLTKEA